MAVRPKHRERSVKLPQRERERERAAYDRLGIQRLPLSTNAAKSRKNARRRSKWRDRTLGQSQLRVDARMHARTLACCCIFLCIVHKDCLGGLLCLPFVWHFLFIVTHAHKYTHVHTCTHTHTRVHTHPRTPHTRVHTHPHSRTPPPPPHTHTHTQRAHKYHDALHSFNSPCSNSSCHRDDSSSTTDRNVSDSSFNGLLPVISSERFLTAS